MPLSKLRYFCEVLEQHVYKLVDDRGMFDLIPLILAEERKRIKAKLEGKNVSMIFDGTSRLGEALAVILCFVSMDDKWKIEQ